MLRSIREPLNEISFFVNDTPIILPSFLLFTLSACHDCRLKAPEPHEPVAAGKNVSDPCAAVERLLPVAADMRGLQPLGPVRCEALEPDAFREASERSARSAIDRGRLEAEERVYQLLGLIPSNFPYARCLGDGSSVAPLAYFDPHREMLVLRTDLRTPDAAIVHELVHALQHQHFDLKRFRQTVLWSDVILAREAVAEGDASWVEEHYRRAHSNPEDEKNINPGNPPLNPECELPDSLTTIFDFPYDWGRRYMSLLRSSGGSRSVDDRFRRPPQQTRDILFPKLDVVTERRDFSGSGHTTGDTKADYEDDLGSLLIRELLRQYVDTKTAFRAAKNVTADHLTYAVMSNREALSWKLSCESKEDAEQVESAISDYVAVRFKDKSSSGRVSDESIIRVDVQQRNNSVQLSITRESK